MSDSGRSKDGDFESGYELIAKLFRLDGAAEWMRSDFESNKVLYAELVRKAFSYVDQGWFSEEHMDREARERTSDYLAAAAEIERDYADSSSVIFDDNGCRKVAGFATRHLKGMPEVYNNDEDKIAGVLKAYHSFRFEVLKRARRVDDQRRRVLPQRSAQPDEPFANQDKILELERKASQKIKELTEQIMNDPVFTYDEKCEKVSEMVARTQKELLKVKRELGYIK